MYLAGTCKPTPKRPWSILSPHRRPLPHDELDQLRFQAHQQPPHVEPLLDRSTAVRRRSPRKLLVIRALRNVLGQESDVVFGGEQPGPGVLHQFRDAGVLGHYDRHTAASCSRRSRGRRPQPCLGSPAPRGGGPAQPPADRSDRGGGPRHRTRPPEPAVRMPAYAGGAPCRSRSTALKGSRSPGRRSS